MAGYIGSKAVTLSTTAADVAGNAVIDGDLTVKGTTVTIDSAAVQEIKLGDNDKLTFGDATGGDLQIYHDGSNSYIEDAGTGWLLLKGNDSGVAAQDGSGNYVWYANQNGFGAYYNNSVKLATTSTGVDITGTLTSDGLTVDGGSVNNDSNAIAAKINANGNEHIRLEISTNSTIGNQAALDLISNSNTSRIYTTGTSGLTFSTDGGSTAHLTVDGSGNVGIGGAASSFGSGVATLQLKGLASGKTAAVTFRDNGGTDVASIFAQNDATYGLSIGTLGATGDFVRFHTGALGTERMRIDSAGRVTMPYQPAFSVTHSSNAYLSGTIVFNTAQVNVGGHYSTSTGRFTAPVAGNYYFIFATIVGNSGGFEVILQKNGSGVTGVGYCSTGSNDTGVVAKVISLSAGDYVTAYTSTGNIESQYSSFAGYLIG